ncbi:MAG TPA: FkbM family methyltransferase [Bryobacterales bacterium]|nr:FkbM family methyltransferase [Bryobacterales bacterium]
MGWTETRFGKRILLAAIVVQLLVASVIVGLWAFPEVILLYWSLTIKSEICPWYESFSGLREAARTTDAQARAAEHSELIRRDENGLQLWSTPLGELWFPKSTEAQFVHFVIAQSQVDAYSGIPVREGDVVLDCGGFVGDWTKFALAAGASKVITVEPSHDALECIRRNLADEISQGRVILYPKGVWDKDERLYLGSVEGNPAGNSVTSETSGPGEWIELTTVDKIVVELGLDRIDVIKMDIEGAETRALRGARATLNRFRPRLAVATEHTEDILQNNRDVITVVREIAPFYSPKCGYCVLAGEVVPFTLYFVQ